MKSQPLLVLIFAISISNPLFAASRGGTGGSGGIGVFGGIGGAGGHGGSGFHGGHGGRGGDGGDAIYGGHGGAGGAGGSSYGSVSKQNSFQNKIKTLHKNKSHRKTHHSHQSRAHYFYRAHSNRPINRNPQSIGGSGGKGGAGLLGGHGGAGGAGGNAY